MAAVHRVATPPRRRSQNRRAALAPSSCGPGELCDRHQGRRRVKRGGARHPGRSRRKPGWRRLHVASDLASGLVTPRSSRARLADDLAFPHRPSRSSMPRASAYARSSASACTCSSFTVTQSASFWDGLFVANCATNAPTPAALAGLRRPNGYGRRRGVTEAGESLASCRRPPSRSLHQCVG